jgi:uncharacterized protein YceK
MVLKYLLVAALVTIAGCSSLRKNNTSSQSAASGSTAPQPAKPMSQPSWMQAGAKTPAMDSSRKINEQSCTSGGVDFTAGNLRCK